MAEKKEIKKEETTKEELKNKINSRKLWVWALWSVLIIALVIISFIRNNDEILLKGLEYYFFISVAYMGANAYVKKLQKDGTITK